MMAGAGASRFVSGDRELDRSLRRVEAAVAKKCMFKAIRAGQNVIKAAIKKEIPARHKSARMSIKSRFAKIKGSRSGRMHSKVGGGVGKHPDYASFRAKYSRTTGGVGISPNNIHWYLMGTRVRAGGRGAMPQSSAVPRGFAKSAGPAMVKLRERLAKETEKEASKIGASTRRRGAGSSSYGSDYAAAKGTAF